MSKSDSGITKPLGEWEYYGGLKPSHDALRSVANCEAWEQWARLHADEIYATDDIAVDPKGKVSEGEDGFWVQAWVWVGHREMPLYDEEHDDEGDLRV